MALRSTLELSRCWLGIGALAAGLAGCSTFEEPEARPAFVPEACCGDTLTRVPDQGLLRHGKVVTLGPNSAWHAWETGLAPVASWQLPVPRGESQLELVVPLKQRPEARQSVPMLTVRFIDELGQTLNVPVIGPRAEQASAPQVRWWVEVPASAVRVVVGVDASQVGRTFTLNITDEGASTMVSGIRLQAPDVVTPVPLRASLEGTVRLMLQGV